MQKELIQSKIDQIQNEIDDLEGQIEYKEEEQAVFNKRINEIQWVLGIKVSKDQLPLF